MRLALFNENGTPYEPAETTDLSDFLEAVPAANQADVAALTQAAITGGESPTEAEFNALRDDHAATRTVVNALLAKLKTAGLMVADA
jgi:hypothetical protein